MKETLPTPQPTWKTRLSWLIKPPVDKFVPQADYQAQNTADFLSKARKEIHFVTNDFSDDILEREVVINKLTQILATRNISAEFITGIGDHKLSFDEALMVARDKAPKLLALSRIYFPRLSIYWTPERPSREFGVIDKKHSLLHHAQDAEAFASTVHQRFNDPLIGKGYEEVFQVWRKNPNLCVLL